MDVSMLTPRQRANVAGLQLKREAIKRKYGNAVQIITTDEEAAAASGWMATPINLVNSNKQLTVYMDKKVVDSTKSRKLSETLRDENASSAYDEDIIAAMERSVSEMRGNKPKPAAQTVSVEARRVPVAAPVSDASVSDHEFLAGLLGK